MVGSQVNIFLFYQPEWKLQLCHLAKWYCNRLVYATLGIFVGRSEQSVMMEKARGILYTRDGQFTRQIIVDATHVEAAVRAKSVPQVLRELTKGLRKEIYRHEYDLSEKFPDKPGLEADVEEEIDQRLPYRRTISASDSLNLSG